MPASGAGGHRQVFADWDDFRVLADAGPATSGLTLVAMVRNEMYFLPAFLAHYRALGVSRFVILDDRSDDGSREYLAGQKDVRLLASAGAYGDPIRLRLPGRWRPKATRRDHAWRNRLLERHATEAWAVHVDADEFLRLPEGMTLPGLLARVEARAPRARVVWSVMLDVYPAHLSALAAAPAEAPLDRARGWQFDARPHLHPRRNRHPRLVYAGSRARLLQAHGVIRRPEAAPGSRLRALLGRGVRPYNLLRKPAILRRPAAGALVNAHSVNFRPTIPLCLPLEHFKFTPSLHARVERALASGGYHDGSREYVHLQLLLQRMAAGDGSFLGPHSRPTGPFRRYLESGVAVDAAGLLAG